MEYGGINLRTYIVKTPWNVRVQKLQWITEQIVMGLQFLHHNSIFHRDLKPDNILIFGDRIRLCDFGISKKVDYDNHTLGSVGTANYRAPEIFSGVNFGYDEKVDIWSLGCLLYEFICGNPLFKGSTDLLRISNIMKIVPTSQEDLDMLGLDMINLDKCNKTEYFKISSFYGLGCPLDVQKLLNNFKNIIQSMICLDPCKRPSCDEILDVMSTPKTPPKILDAVRYNRCIPDSLVNRRRVELEWIFDQKVSLRTYSLCIEIFDYVLSNLHTINVSNKNKIIKNLRIITTVCLGLSSKYIDVISIKYKNIIDYCNNIFDWEVVVLKMIDFNLEFKTIYMPKNDLKQTYLDMLLNNKT